MNKRSINERIEDGILLLAITINFIRASRLEKIKLSSEEKQNLFRYFPRTRLFKFICTEKQFIDLKNSTIENQNYKDKFYGCWFSSNNGSNYFKRIIARTPISFRWLVVHYTTEK